MYSNGQFQLPSLSFVNKVILSMWGVFFLLDTSLRLALDFSLASWMALSITSFKLGHFYQLITYPFVHTQLWDLLLHALVLLFMGSALESRWGQKKYISFLVLTTLFVGFLFLLGSLFFTSWARLPLFGAGAWLFAMSCAYALLEPHAMFSLMFIFPVKAPIAVALLLLLDLYSGLFGQLGSAALANILGAVAAFITVKFPQLLSFKKSTTTARTKSSHLRLIKETEDNNKQRKSDPKYWQ